MRGLLVALLLLPSAGACSWHGPEGLALVDPILGEATTWQVGHMGASADCRIIVTAEVGDVVAWIDRVDGDPFAPRTPVLGTEDGARSIPLPIPALDVSSGAGRVYASGWQELDNILGRPVLYELQGKTWIEAPVQPSLPWGGALDGALAVSAAEVVWSWDLVNSRFVVAPTPRATLEAQYGTLVGAKGGVFLFDDGSHFTALGAAEWSVPHGDLGHFQEPWYWAVDGRTIYWAEQGVLMRSERGMPATPVEVGPNMTELIHTVVSAGAGRILVASLGIDQWLDQWQPAVTNAPAAGTVQPPLAPTPMAIAWMMLSLVAAAGLARKR